MDEKRGITKRKQTLLSLLDALNELTKDEDIHRDSSLHLNFEDDRDVPTVDEHIQKVGAESFTKFELSITNLDKQLRNFSNAARQLGSSVRILSSSYLLRERLAQILYLFHENAASLFSRKIHHQDQRMPVDPLTWRQGKRAKTTVPPNVRNPVVLGDLDPETFPLQIEKLGDDITTFLECLNEFPEFTDEAVNASVVAFQGDLKYWASCLNEYAGQFRYPAVQRYLHDLSSELGEHIDSITASLSLFIEIGVPTIRFAQEHGAANLLNLSTVATFFSAVTATTLQFSISDTTSSAANAVNALWFTSLVFSIAAAVNSLLGLTWKQAMYRSPRQLVPWWVSMWIRRSPLIFLVLSVACFSAGLVVFTYSSQQHYLTTTVTTVFSAFSSFGLAAVSAWFASERIVFNHHKGQKWLAEVLDDASDQFVSISGLRWMKTIGPRRFITWGGKLLQWVSAVIDHVKFIVTEKFPTGIATHGLDIPTSEGVDVNGLQPTCSKSPTLSECTKYSVFGAAHPSDPLDIDGVMQNRDSSDQAPSAPRIRFANLVRNVIMVHRSSGLGTPSSARGTSSSGVDTHTRDHAEHAVMPKSSRVTELVPRLRNMKLTQDIAAHTALVRHIEFSPDGKFLATSSWDRTSVIFRVGEPFTSHRVLLHPTGFIGQVAWSPSGNIIMTKLPRAVKIWTQDGVCRRTIDRPRHVHSIAWLPGGEAFLSVEESDVVRLDINGNVMDTYHFDRMHLNGVAVTSDCQRIFTVGTLIQSADGLQPFKSRSEKQIIAYNLERKEFENRVPVLHDIRDITLSRNNQFVLVSYENKVPPQLWKIDMLKNQNPVARLNLRHTYMPKITADFAGPSYFGGKDDQLILCAGRAGDIHIWDRESAALLHHVRAPFVGGDMTSIAWNQGADPFMFATGSHDGGVRIWTTTAGSQQASPYPEVRILMHPPEVRTRSPSPLPPDSECRNESSETFLRSDLRVEIRDSLTDLPYQPSV